MRFISLISFLVVFISGPAFSQEDSASFKENIEFQKKQQKLNTLETKVNNGRDTLKHLIKLKKSNQPFLDDEGKDITLEKIVEVHTDLRSNAKTYNELRAKVKYNYPEKGKATDRRYLPMRVQSLEDIENEIGTDGLLTRLKLRVDNKYRSFLPENQVEKGGKKRLKPPPKKVLKEKPKRLRLEQ